jgi:hypothetical protein
MRFSIWDLLWGTVVVAMGLGWWVSSRDAATRVEKLEALVELLRDGDRVSRKVHKTQVRWLETNLKQAQDRLADCR